MLSIKSLHANVDEKEILKGLNLEVKKGEVHVIMGPNGSGKSTLANVIAGKESFNVTGGSISYLDENILNISPEERAQKGIFLAFQYPVSLPGVTNINFLKASYNAICKAKGQKPLDAIDFMSMIRKKIDQVALDESFLYRATNEGFSGGEKKRNEMLQMILLEPKLAILDETDSGLDIDALKVVAKAVNSMRDENRSFIIVTHYQRLLDYIIPDHVHVLSEGKIKKSGDKELARELDKTGYSQYIA